METRIIISQIIMLAVIVLTGVIAGKTKVFTVQSKDMLSKLIFNISLPMMLFTNFLKLEVTPRLLSNSLIVLSLAFFTILFMLLAGWIVAKILKIGGGEAAVFRAHSMLGNTIFLGFPLITALYGVEGLLYATMFQFVSSILMWTLGVVVITHGDGSSWRKSIHKVLNINTFATIAGLIFFIFSIRLPDLIIKPLSEFGSANTWLSMLYIGAMLAFSDIKGLLGKRSIYILSVNRLVFVPAIIIAIFAVFYSFSGLEADKLVSSVIILEASMPCMASVVIMARELGADDHLAVGNVFVSTILSILTLPVVLMAINKFL